MFTIIRHIGRSSRQENGTWMLILILLVAQLPKELIFSVFNMPTNQVRKYFVLLFL